MARPDYIALEDGQTGTVAWYKADKNYGFIKPDAGGEDVFLHSSHLLDGYQPAKGDKVKYSLAEDRRRKRVYAVEVELA